MPERNGLPLAGGGMRLRLNSASASMPLLTVPRSRVSIVLPMSASNVYVVTMRPDSNTVNIDKRPYHHGDLRAALVTEGLRLLAERDAESLSLREVARAAGVSSTSVYRHFPDKEALMTALALEGLARLGTAQREAADAVGGGEAGFRGRGGAVCQLTG